MNETEKYHTLIWSVHGQRPNGSLLVDFKRGTSPIFFFKSTVYAYHESKKAVRGYFVSLY